MSSNIVSLFTNPSGQAIASTDQSATASQQQPIQDCLPCRVMGGVVFSGLGVYTYFSGHSQLRENEAQILKTRSVKIFPMAARRAGITGIAATLVGAGVYRMIM